MCYFIKFALANIKLKSVISLECAQQLTFYQQIKRAAFRCTHSQLTESAIETFVKCNAYFFLLVILIYYKFVHSQKIKFK